MNKIIFCGDKHFQSKEPFYSAQKDFIKWFHNQSWNSKDNIYIDLGDIFHNSLPDPKTNSLVLEFFQGLKFKKIYILQGNHDYCGAKHQTALSILKELGKDIKIIDFAKKIRIENLNCLFLPYFYPSQVREKEISSLYSFYSNLPEEFIIGKYDYLFSHVEDETQNFGSNKFIDFSNLTVNRRISGHIHNASVNYLGVPVLTRYDEKNHNGKILEIDVITKEEKFYVVPKFISYEDIVYPDDLIFNKDVKYPIFTIKDCIDKDSAENFYINKYKDKKLYFRGFYKKSNDIESEVSGTNKDLESLSIFDHFTNFFKENKLEKTIEDLCKAYFPNIGGL